MRALSSLERWFCDNFHLQLFKFKQVMYIRATFCSLSNPFSSLLRPSLRSSPPFLLHSVVVVFQLLEALQMTGEVEDATNVREQPDMSFRVELIYVFI